MTVEEAIKELQLELNIENEICDCAKDTAWHFRDKPDIYKKRLIDIRVIEQNAETFRMAIDALKKQIPKKPKIDINHWYLWCTACKQRIYRDETYCSTCGQKIDWRDE